MKDNVETFRKMGLVAPTVVPMAAEVAPEVEDDEGQAKCFGYLRGVRDRAINLELVRNREGDTVSFPYSWLGPARFHPSQGILLVFSAGELFGVRIRGRNLNAVLADEVSLFGRGLMRQRVTWIREMTERESHAALDRECVVDRIEVAPLKPEDVTEFLGLA